MNSHFVAVLLVALAFGHSIAATDQTEPSSSRSVFGRLLDVLTNGFKPSPHIIGGGETRPHSYPYQVALVGMNGDKVYQCGGSLISPQWILTAAHCATNVNSVTAVLGSHDLRAKESKTRQVIRVAGAYLYRDPSEEVLNDDIALLKLAKPATLNKYVQTIRLPSSKLRRSLRAGQKVVLIGWGRYSDKKEEGSPVLKAVQTKLLTTRDCSYLFEAWLPRTILCASGAHRRGVCNGDSGGPMILTESDGKETVIGVASFVSEYGCEKGFPSAFTRVDSYLPWIARITGIRNRRM